MWHRYFLHAFEQTLRRECSYEGALPYWDWTLDWASLVDAPFFAASVFGGNGDPDAPRTIDSGSCLSTGPFANLPHLFYRDTYRPHRLLRGIFQVEEEK